MRTVLVLLSLMCLLVPTIPAAAAVGVAPDDLPFTFSTSQTIDSATVTCSSVDNTATYTECRDLKKDGLYFPNGVQCGPLWSNANSPYSDTQGFCTSLTGSDQFEVYYDCTGPTSRATWYDHVWGTFTDNGYTKNVRCYYPTALAAPSLSATKTVSAGPLAPGGTVTWTVVIANTGTAAQPDNAGDEFVDVLPAGVALQSAQSSSGTTTANIFTNTVSWNGSLAASSTVTLTISATILASPGSVIANSGTVYFDEDLNSTNESAAATDDPSTQAAGDGTAFTVADPPPPVPTLPPASLAILTLLLLAVGMIVVRLR